jgi:hypothetical protein
MLGLRLGALKLYSFSLDYPANYCPQFAPQLHPNGSILALSESESLAAVWWQLLFRQTGGNAMLAGKRFRLNSDTVAIETHGDKPIAITIPSSEVVEVIWDPLPTDARMAGIRWNGRLLVMFTADVEGHGEEIKDRRVTV